MPSRRQLEANRSNARRSTGPQTESGKNRSKMNAVKHGLAGANIVVLDEDPAQFEALRSGLEVYLNLVAYLNRNWSIALPACCGACGRIPLIEAALIRHQIEQVEESERGEAEIEEENRRWQEREAKKSQERAISEGVQLSVPDTPENRAFIAQIKAILKRQIKASSGRNQGAQTVDGESRPWRCRNHWHGWR